MKVTINYTLSEKGQKFALANGLKATQKQEVILEDTENKLLPFITVSYDGKATLDLDRILKTWWVKKEAVFSNPDYPHFYLDSDKEWVYYHTYKVDDYNHLNIDTIINNVDEIIYLISACNDARTALEQTIPAMAKKELEEYEDAKQKYNEQEADKIRKKQIRTELEAEYQDSLAKIKQIRELVDGKQRVRTAQILDIMLKESK